MPGIAGYAGVMPSSDLLPQMLVPLKQQKWYTRDEWVNPESTVALGRVGLGLVNTASQPAVSCDGTKRAVLEGEIYEYERLRRDLESRGHRFRSTSHAELLLHGMQRSGLEFVRGLKGCFSAAVWDESAGTLTLLNDRFGMRPLYYSHSPGRLAFGSQIKSLLADSDLSRATDPRGLAQFFTFGQYLGDTTSFAAVNLLPAAGVATYRVDEDTLKVQTYASLGENWGDGRTDRGAALERITDALSASVARCTNNTRNLGLSLSGGLDARTILGLIDPAQPVKTLCLGIEGSIDVQCAAELARLSCRTHQTHILGTDFLNDFGRHLLDMVRMTDGQYLCQCIVMPTLPLYRQLGIDVLVRGHAGELMHMSKAYNFSMDAEAESLTESALEPWLWRRLQSHMLDGVQGTLFTPAFGMNLTEQARASLRQSLNESRDIGPPVHRIWHLFVSERIRRETALSMVEFGSVVETRVPYLDTDVIDALMSAPPSLKLGEAIQEHILRERQPSFLSVVNANTGARIGAGPLPKLIAKARLKVLAKLGVKGYQPYERLGLWLRRELRGLVQSILLDDRCLSRGIFNPETVRSVVANHLSSRRNHTYLLMAMMVHELSQREFVDGETAQVPAMAGQGVA
jgi:asparagine synthase (glutamine-hydrolysing)